MTTSLRFLQFLNASKLIVLRDSGNDILLIGHPSNAASPMYSKVDGSTTDSNEVQFLNIASNTLLIPSGIDMDVISSPL